MTQNDVTSVCFSKRMVNIVKDMRVMNYDVFATLGKSVAFSSNIVGKSTLCLRIDMLM